MKNTGFLSDKHNKPKCGLLHEQPSGCASSQWLWWQEDTAAQQGTSTPQQQPWPYFYP